MFQNEHVGVHIGIVLAARTSVESRVTPNTGEKIAFDPFSHPHVGLGHRIWVAHASRRDVWCVCRQRFAVGVPHPRRQWGRHTGDRCLGNQRLKSLRWPAQVRTTHPTRRRVVKDPLKWVFEFRASSWCCIFVFRTTEGGRKSLFVRRFENGKGRGTSGVQL